MPLNPDVPMPAAVPVPRHPRGMRMRPTIPMPAAPLPVIVLAHPVPFDPNVFHRRPGRSHFNPHRRRLLFHDDLLTHHFTPRLLDDHVAPRTLLLHDHLALRVIPFVVDSTTAQ